ncbi:receptor-type protein kinase, putative [Bodo saltans]|uniref:Receptor-type protein kinase, putative n=1 Tax=Bodo saltans TaxID=75058 RepID=A0A0S4KGY5_BODSA|nr:receptor-type protein kinase, putative [Bodo saltans]|eukprot:CUI14951.1 receptor-type protein kinase, putative [Bodo saltans]
MDLSVHCETTVTGVLHLVILRKLRGLNFGSEESQLSSSLKTTCILDISLHLMRPLVLLQRLDLSMSAAITDSALVAISNFLQLRYLSLKRLPKHNRQRTEASHEAKAKSVHATTSPTWDLHASSLSLKFLGIGTCDAEPDACLRRYSIRDPLLLRSLNVSCSSCSGRELMARCVLLNITWTNDCDNLVSILAKSMMFSWIMLRLDISKHSGVTDTSLWYVAQCPRLRHLTMRSCNYVTANGYLYIANMELLECINLTGSSSLDNQCLESLSLSPSLQRIVLCVCPRISDVGVASLASMRLLQHLDVRWCLNVSASAAKQLVDTVEGLEVLHNAS